MRPRRGGLRPCPLAAAGVTAALAVLLVACGSAPPAQPPAMSVLLDDASQAPSPSPSAAAATGEAYEQRLRERAWVQNAQGRLADAAVTWEILTLLRPASQDYREHLADARQRITEAVPDYLQRAEQAQKKGELEVAVAQYLGALALQPDNVKASDALRAIERERNRRNYLGRSAGGTVVAQRPESPPPARANGRATTLDRNDFEHAAMLAAQGELDEAIALLERRLAVDKRDALACQLLADMYYRKAEQQLPKNRAGAKAWLDKSARLDASNPRVVALLKQLVANGPMPAAGNCSSVR